jgi:hypothetical protein
VAAKVKEAAEVRARFEEERKRYLELTGKKSSDAAAVAPAAAAAAPAAAAPAPAAPAPAAPAPAKPAEKK